MSCIESRALLIQGNRYPRSHLEPLDLVHYVAVPGQQQQQHRPLHNDWFPDAQLPPAIEGGNRASTILAYVHVRNGTTGGGTNFPLLDAPRDPRWCDVVDCDEPWERGLTFRLVEGNAIYWGNLFPEHVGGGGDQRTMHSGLALTSGEKMGLNIWTREGRMSEEIRGYDDSLV